LVESRQMSESKEESPEAVDPALKKVIEFQYWQLRQAFVSVTVANPLQPPDQKVAVRSAFVVEINDDWWLISAEHAFLDYEDQPGLLDIIAKRPGTRLFLQPMADRDKRENVPFRFDRSAAICTRDLSDLLAHSEYHNLSNELKDMDLIAIHLSQLYKEHLRALNVKPLTWENVRPILEDELFDFLHRQSATIALVGIPEDTLVEQTGSCWVEFSRLPVSPAKSELPFIFVKPEWKEKDRSYSIKGVSGGPLALFGLERLYILGVQVSQIQGDPYLYRAVTAQFFFEVLRESQAIFAARSAPKEELN